ncbi:MAG: zinc ABC transporter substrate-binding protein [Bacteroidota bacterium]
MLIRSKGSNLILAFLFLFSFAQAQDDRTIVATASMIADIAENIAGDQWAVESIVPIGGDPHTYRPTPGDAKRVLRARLIFMNGLTFEGWLNDLIQNSGTEATVVTVTDGIEPLTSLTYQTPDPHAWMNPLHGVQYAENIMNTLSAADPQNQAFYQQNFDRYRQELIEMDNYITEAIRQIPEEHRILITSHDAFQYYGRKYGLRLESILGISTDADIQTNDVINLQKVIADSQVPAVFIETTVNPKMLQELASDNGIQIGGSLLSDSLGDRATGGDTYLKMLRYNTDIIVQGLTGQAPKTEKEKEQENWWFTGGILSLFLLGFVYMYFRMRKLNA